jgi:hypothetical protein
MHVPDVISSSFLCLEHKPFNWNILFVLDDDGNVVDLICLQHWLDIIDNSSDVLVQLRMSTNMNWNIILAPTLEQSWWIYLPHIEHEMNCHLYKL